MKKVSVLVTSLPLFFACGRQDAATQADLSSEKFSIRVLGIEMGSCTRDELTRFVAGEFVEPISKKLPREQQLELRQKFSRVLQFPGHRAQAAIASENGKKLNTILQNIFPGSYRPDLVAEAFVASVEDHSFTLLEFVTRYPSDVLKVNGLAFMSQKADLEQALLELERQYKE